MMIKFHGGGSSGRATAEYLEDETDHKGRERAGVTVLRGDPQLVGQVIDSLDFKHRRTSAVIAWAPEDKPTDAQINDVLDSFEHLAWSGLEPDRYAWSAVRHDEPKDGVHIHILAARVDLDTGKSLNIAPPGWDYHFDPWRDYHNLKHGWARPDDPARSRNVQRGGAHLADADKIKSGEMTPDDLKKELTNYLTFQIDAGIVSNRAKVLTSLSEFGEITRAGKNYISIKPPGYNKAVRLKGVIYDEQFNAGTYQENKAAAERSRGDNRAGTTEEINDVAARYRTAIRDREECNKQKYGRSGNRTAKVQVQALDIPTDSLADARSDNLRQRKILGRDDSGENEQSGDTRENPGRTQQSPAGHRDSGDNTRRQGRQAIAAPAERRKRTEDLEEPTRTMGFRSRRMNHDRVRKPDGGENERNFSQPDPLVDAIRRTQQTLEIGRRKSGRIRDHLRRTLERIKFFIAAWLKFTGDMKKSAQQALGYGIAD